MRDHDATQQTLHCPSAPPEWTGSVVLGIVGGSPQEPALAHLSEPLPVTDELLSLAAPVHPAEVFRFAAPCASEACRHFAESRCRLVSKIVELLPAVVETLPACFLRPRCRWWRQEGAAACFRCPQIVTENHSPIAPMEQAADPSI